MRKFIEDFFALAALVGTEAWFLKGYFADQPDFEPALAFIAALGIVLAKDPLRARLVAPEKSASPHDKELFRAFTDLLPPNQTARFFKEHDFGGSFSKSDVAPLYSFVETWDSVDKEFLDEELEAKRKAIYSLASELAKEIACRTVPLRSGDLFSVFSDQQRATGQPRPASVIEDAKFLNEKSSLFVPKYEEFVRLCKGKLEK
ncbi:hypothetical protein H8K38_07285 [Undibacterium sp. FT79W]|uniref:hypothetical protein n=1 Tax=Undibacterium sp. FT79W TaxID=2762296 RepID=UPI00164B519C|nr:hypothetical protein [Undibacterium sp. FT79W]MBC3877605.1 hypothetical protein [Undibacterium sp. FT79W]